MDKITRIDALEMMYSRNSYFPKTIKYRAPMILEVTRELMTEIYTLYK